MGNSVAVFNPFENETTNLQNTNLITSELLSDRQTQEVQAAMIIAKKFPRDEILAYEKIKKACQRKFLAEKAMYSYPRANQLVTGASIRLAEVLAQTWGNIDFGIIELERSNGKSQVMAYAWDLENNTRQSKIFTVNHIRSTKKGNIPLTDEREIYELIASNGARRMRNCILSIIPIDIVEAAIAQCNQTLLDNSGKMPIEDLKRNMVLHFKDDLSVSLDVIEIYIGYKIEHFTVEDLAKLQKIYNSIKDGIAKREDYFNFNKENVLENPFEKEVKKEKQKNNKKEKKTNGEADGGQLLLPES